MRTVRGVGYRMGTGRVNARPPSGTAAGPGLAATRLLVAQALVLAAGAATTWLVASVVGPSSSTTT